jgi:hypothetical protein
MSLRGYYQNAYVTRDLDKAIQTLSELHDVGGFWPIEADFVLKTVDGEKSARMRVALGWVGNLQIELIQPVSGFTEIYSAYLPEDPADASPRHHHVAVRRDDLDAMRAEVARLDAPVVFEGEGPGIQYVLVDARKSLGHYLEYVWATPEGRARVGWPVETTA